MERPELAIQLEGEIGPWTFRWGGSCGAADLPSASIYLPHRRPDGSVMTVACTIRRDDITKLREFLQQCEAIIADESGL